MAKKKEPEQAELAEEAESAEKPETASESNIADSVKEPVEFESTWTMTSCVEKGLPNIYQRMVIARQRMRYIKKTRQGGLKYATVNHDEVTVAAQEALDYANVLAIPTVIAHGKEGNTTWAECMVTFVNPDTPEERYAVEMFGEFISAQDKGPGGAISYTLKVCYIKALMGEAGEKDADMQDLDSEPDPPAPDPPAPDPQTDEMGSPADREDLYDALKHYAEKLDIPWPDVRAHLISTFGDSPKLWQLKAAESSIIQSPDIWRKPKGEK